MFSINAYTQVFDNKPDADRYNGYLNSITGYPRNGTDSYTVVTQSGENWIILQDDLVDTIIPRIKEYTGDIDSDSLNSIIQASDSMTYICLYDNDTTDITSRINLESGVSIIANDVVFKVANSFENNAIFGNQVNNIILEGFTLDCNGNNQTSKVDGILFYSSNRIFIRNCTVVKSRNRAIALVKTSNNFNNVYIENNYLDNLAHGIEVKDAEKVTITFNTFINVDTTLLNRGNRVVISE